ncbi:hypothetical protein GO755_29590 [Spirosoma sp. HMF4905]|uniref:YopA central domain-containing protein n=1 Tax=Spirosoma arboris TaxID=2682092 RepID=A0A7K1SK80_9BACT|nr:hypothetical protein [Spirosoma arboris]MVM34221.1 hypothetical protein [Spirosoma arboris]
MPNESKQIKELVQMEKPNESIVIYKGIFQLITDDIVIEVEGSLTFEWFPSIGSRFTGNVVTENSKVRQSVQFRVYDLIIDGLPIGQCFVSVIISSDALYIEGAMKGLTVIGDKSVPVSKVTFSIANLKEFYGSAVKTETGYISGRLLFENEGYIIKIDKLTDYSERHFMLRNKGGYLILYTGEITSRKGSIKRSDIHEQLILLSAFLNFLNGRRCSPIFRKGVFEDDIKWCDYTAYHVDQFKFVNSWAPPSKSSFDAIWGEFCKLWKDTNNRQFMTDAIHWYTEANNQSGLVDGAIIMAQTALELIYNWLLVEQKRFIIGKDAENISAANKIRLLISLLKISNNVPPSFRELNKYIDCAAEEVQDAPDAFVQIRNALVHSQATKRRKVAEMNDMLKYESLQLGLWYVELSLLYILNYKGKYINRCNIYTDRIEIDVPWV